MEQWRKAVGCYEHVEISDFGNVRIKGREVRCVRNGKVTTQKRPPKNTSPWIAKNGYKTISIKCHGERKKFLIHRLVARTFVPGYVNGLTVNHIDGNKLNNHHLNLEWITLSENTRKQWASGLVNLRGENHPSHKISDKQAQLIKIHSGNVSDLAKKLGVSVSLIYKIKNNVKRKI